MLFRSFAASLFHFLNSLEIDESQPPTFFFDFFGTRNYQYYLNLQSLTLKEFLLGMEDSQKHFKYKQFEIFYAFLYIRHEECDGHWALAKVERTKKFISIFDSGEVNPTKIEKQMYHDPLKICLYIYGWEDES